MKRVDDFRLKFGKKEYVPLMIGGMGVDISTAELALEAVRLGGIGHISDAMVPDVSDRRFDTEFVKEKTKFYKYNIANSDKSDIKFDLGRLAEATRLHVGKTMEAKQGEGMIFVNCMEKLTMNAPRETLQVRLNSALDAGVDGITLSAGLHLGSFALMADHPRFRDAKLYFLPLAERGPFVAALSTKNEQGQRAREVLMATIERFRTQGPTPEELNAAIKNITGGFPLRIAGNGKIAQYLAMIGFYGLPLDYLDRFNDRISAVTAEGIRDAFQRRIDPARFATVIVGPVVKAPVPPKP